MALFQYSAVDLHGKKKEGLINADSIKRAKLQLSEQKILVTKLKSYKKQLLSQTLPSETFLHLTRDLEVLLRAGLPLYESLLTLKEKYSHAKPHLLLIDLCERVKQGEHLSKALACYPKIFDDVYIAIVKAGEESGSLDQSFADLSKLITRREKLKKRVTTAMIYPIFLASFALVVIGVLLFFLIPSMKDLFEGRNLHPLTRGVLSVSTFLSENTLLIFSLFIATLLSLFFLIRQKRGREWSQGFVLRLPIARELTIKSVMTRFCRVFSVLIQGGTSILDSLRLARQVLRNIEFEKIIRQAESKIVEGERLSGELSKHPLIPRLVIRIMALAEESGNMSKLMQHVADIYEEELERSLNRLTSFLQPVILLFLGFVVAIILLSVLLPLTDISFIN